jgi:hypothetical protein
MKKIDIAGQKFGRLTALKPLCSTNQGVKWLFLCDCGNEYVTFGKQVKINSDVKSCGCYKKQQSAERCKTLTKTHGMTYSPEWYSWISMKQRCDNPNNPKYKHYGGRGIKYCESWKKFENFYNEMGSRLLNTTLDRIDVNGNYTKDNCKWSTFIEQNNNKRKRND